MGYKAECIEYSKVPDMINEFPYALIYKYSGVILGRNETDSGEALKECIEARFFGDAGELHVLADENKAILITDEGKNGECIEKELRLKERFCAAGESLVVKQYLESDEDGQYYVALTRLKGII